MCVSLVLLIWKIHDTAYEQMVATLMWIEFCLKNDAMWNRFWCNWVYTLSSTFHHNEYNFFPFTPNYVCTYINLVSVFVQNIVVTIAFANKKQKVIPIYLILGLEEEMPDKQVSPISCILIGWVTTLWSLSRLPSNP